jgi:hypothetical protein
MSLQQVTSVCLLDLSAAFVTINHSILFERLRSWFGFNNTVLSWIKSYFTHRSFYVNLNGNKLSVFQLSYGVPQGSVLGPQSSINKFIELCAWDLFFSFYTPLHSVPSFLNPLQIIIYTQMIPNFRPICLSQQLNSVKIFLILKTLFHWFKNGCRLIFFHSL